MTTFYPHINNLQDFHYSWSHPDGGDDYPWECGGSAQLFTRSKSGCTYPAECPTWLQNVVYALNPTLPTNQWPHTFFHTFRGNPVDLGATYYAHGPSGIGDAYFAPANSIGFVTSNGNFFCWASTTLRNLGNDNEGACSDLLCGRLQ